MAWFENRRELVLPGDFVDPLGLADLVAVEALDERREFLSDLGAVKLDFRTYVLKYLSRALEDETLDPTIRQAAVTLLADRRSELVDDDEAYQVLSPVRLVRCEDGGYRHADECYFPGDGIREVLGNNANVAVLPEERKAAVRELLDWLGVASEPRLRDIVATARRIVGAPYSPTAVVQIQKIVAHIGQRFKDFEELFELETLQSIEWLPARRDTSQWHQPSSLYAPYRSYLFKSQGMILDVPSPNSDFLRFLGVHIEPTPDLVVRHLLYCAEQEMPVNTEVYSFLNSEANDPAIKRLRSKECLWLRDAYRSPDHVFWDDHPFGKYRWRLAGNLRGYEDLLEKIGVAETPNHEDALDVLQEISAEFGAANRPLDDNGYAVLMGCWQMLEEALDAGTITNGCLQSLRSVKSIPNNTRVLCPPTWLFFENRVGLAAKFGAFLANNVIPRPLGAGQVFLAAGVRQLGSAVKIELLRNDSPVDDPRTTESLQRRHEEIARVLSCQMASHDVEVARDRLSRLDCKSATSLVVQYSLEAFGDVQKSEPELIPALYQRGSHSLWTTHLEGQLPWASLARELAIALCPEEDPGLFAAGLKEVLAAEAPEAAARVLDELGFARLDTTIVEVPSSEEAAQQLGEEVPIDNDGALPPRHSEDENQPGVPPATPGSKSPEPAGPPSSRRARSGGGQKFVSYVVLSPEEEEEADPDDPTQQERMGLEDKAIELILRLEPKLKRMKPGNRGFDLREIAPDGRPVKWVEVKAMKGTLQDRPVGLSRAQFEWAQKHAGSYWLYVVERADVREQARIVRIKDPAGKAQTFTFDHGWIAVAEDIEGEDSEN